MWISGSHWAQSNLFGTLLILLQVAAHCQATFQAHVIRNQATSRQLSIDTHTAWFKFGMLCIQGWFPPYPGLQISDYFSCCYHFNDLQPVWPLTSTRQLSLHKRRSLDSFFYLYISHGDGFALESQLISSVWCTMISNQPCLVHSHWNSHVSAGLPESGLCF